MQHTRQLGQPHGFHVFQRLNLRLNSTMKVVTNHQIIARQKFKAKESHDARKTNYSSISSDLLVRLYGIRQLFEVDRTNLVWPSVPTREFFLKERSHMSVVCEAFVVPIYILATTSTGTLLKEAIVLDVIDGLNNITPKHCGPPWAYTSEYPFGIFAKPK